MGSPRGLAGGQYVSRRTLALRASGKAESGKGKEANEKMEIQETLKIIEHSLWEYNRRKVTIDLFYSVIIDWPLLSIVWMVSLYHRWSALSSIAFVICWLLIFWKWARSVQMLCFSGHSNVYSSFPEFNEDDESLSEPNPMHKKASIGSLGSWGSAAAQSFQGILPYFSIINESTQTLASHRFSEGRK